MSDSIDQNFGANIDAACRQAAAKVVRLARQTGTPVIIWDQDRDEVRAISPDEAHKQLSEMPPLQENDQTPGTGPGQIKPNSTPDDPAHPDRSSD
jgi:hypothetical protein